MASLPRYSNIKTTKQYHKTKHYFRVVNGKPPSPSLLCNVSAEDARVQSKAHSWVDWLCTAGLWKIPVTLSPTRKSQGGFSTKSNTAGSQDPHSLASGQDWGPFILENKIRLAPPTQTQPPRHSAILLHILMIYSRYKCSICYQVTPGPWANYLIHFFSL